MTETNVTFPYIQHTHTQIIFIYMCTILFTPLPIFLNQMKRASMIFSLSNEAHKVIIMIQMLRKYLKSMFTRGRSNQISYIQVKYSPSHYLWEDNKKIIDCSLFSDVSSSKNINLYLRYQLGKSYFPKSVTDGQTNKVSYREAWLRTTKFAHKLYFMLQLFPPTIFLPISGIFVQLLQLYLPLNLPREKKHGRTSHHLQRVICQVCAASQYEK